LNCIHPDAELLVDPNSVSVEEVITTESVESAEADTLEVEEFDETSVAVLSEESVDLSEVSSEETAGEIDVLPIEKSIDSTEEQLDLDIAEGGNDKEPRI